jgi:competence protein ComGC
MSDHPPTTSPEGRGSGRRWLLITVLVGLPLLLLVAIYFYASHLAELNLQEALAEAAAEDPNWRLGDLEASRAVYPENENAALQLLTVKRMIPGGWGSKQEFYDLFNDLPKQHQLDAQQLKALREEMTKAEAAVAEARKLADMPHGHFPIEYTPDWIGTHMYVQDARAIANLLQNDVLLLAQEGDADAALRSARAGLNTARAIEDEPLLISQLVRIACRAIALGNLERVLAQGEPSPEALAEFQKLLEMEDRDNLLLFGLRGERAGSNQLLEAMQTGKVGTTNFMGGMGSSSAESAALSLMMMAPGSLKNQRAALVRTLTRAVQAAKLPPEQQKTEFDQIDADSRHQGVLVRLLLPAVSKVREADCRTHAQTRCALLAVAAERYRRAHGNWPASVDALVADGLLKQAPIDPYDGAPVRYRVREGSVVVYSVAQDRQDDGGKFDGKAGTTKGTDLGITLWDVSQRRLLPLPAKEPEGLPGDIPPGGAPPPPAPQP